MDDDVGRRQGGPTSRVEPQTVHGDVAGHHLDPALDHGLEALPGGVGLGPQTVEGVVAEQLSARSLGGADPPAGTHQQGEVQLWHVAQQPFHQGGAKEPRRAGDEHCLVR